MTNYAQIRFRKESKKYSCPYLEIDKYFHFYLLFFLGFDFINERLLNRASRISASVRGSSWDIPLWDFPYGICNFGNPNPIWDFFENPNGIFFFF